LRVPCIAKAVAAPSGVLHGLGDVTAHLVFLRGVNVGGHRTFRPSQVAERLRPLQVVNVGAAGTFVVRGPVPQARVREAFVRELPFTTQIMICPGRDLLRLVQARPFAGLRADRRLVPFVSVLARARAPASPLPLAFPPAGRWGLRILGQHGRFVVGVYRREMQAIAHLGQIDRTFGVPATTRSWSTMATVARLLERPPGNGSAGRRARG
jgi:uncharacterized protein (DUF1697 family)